jgi:hypothetical protein
MKKTALMVVAIAMAGCSTDSAHTLSRDYRNLDNEAIDALMMITGEARARFARDKIFKPYNERLTKIDDRAATWLQNTEDDFIVRDTMGSESVMTLIDESEVNKTRLKLELDRIKVLLDTKAKDNPGVDPAKEWPALSSFAAGSETNSLKNHLDRNKFFELIAQFKTEKWGKARKAAGLDDIMGALGDRRQRFQ